MITRYAAAVVAARHAPRACAIARCAQRAEALRARRGKGAPTSAAASVLPRYVCRASLLAPSFLHAIGFCCHAIIVFDAFHCHYFQRRHHAMPCHFAAAISIISSFR
jgi:hypothetical protein